VSRDSQPNQIISKLI